MQTPKSRAFHLLDRTLVNDSFTEQKVDSIFFALMQRYAPDVTVELEWPQSFTNPTVTVHFSYTSLREAINTLCMLAHVFFTVTDYGSLRIARPAYSQAMQHAVVIEPDNRTWQKVELPNDGYAARSDRDL